MARDDFENPRLETVVICVLVDSFAMRKTDTHTGIIVRVSLFQGRPGTSTHFSIETMDRGDTLDDGFRYSLLHHLD